MALQAQNYSAGASIPYTAGTDITAGTPTNLYDGIAGIPANDIASGDTDDVQIDGVIKIVCDDEVGNLGDPVWWDSDGDPYGGTAGTGAATTKGSLGDFYLGTLALATGATDTHAYVLLNAINPAIPPYFGRTWELKAATYTVDAEDDGKVITDLTDNGKITLPATDPGLRVVIMNIAADGGAKLSIDPNANDKIMGPDIGGTDNKDLINTKTTQIRCDFVELLGTTNGWFIVRMRGIWATEAG